MSYRHRQLTLQLALVLFCCLFIAVTRTEVTVNSQSSCLVPFWETPPRDSWRQYETLQLGLMMNGVNLTVMPFKRALRSGIKHLTVPR